MKIVVDGKEVENHKGVTALDFAKDNHIAVKLHDKLCDLSTPLSDGQVCEFISFASREGKEVFWHTSAHILAQAILRLWPEAKPTIGPPIDQGFYYDFANLQISESDFPRIEEEVEKIIKENFTPQRKIFSSKEEALKAFENNPYKMELIKEFDGEITGYTQGEFFDLCRGPHLPRLGIVSAFKVMKTSGAYWRGDQEREMLTRVYGISFPDKKMLREHMRMLEEAKKRDHRLLGAKLDLFSLKEEAPAMPFIHPKGMVVWNSLVDMWREMHINAGYEEIKTPQIVSRDLWERSGHWENYRENMYSFAIEKREYAIKPMNCPGCMLYYNSTKHSYREFPMRIAEFGHVYRHEHSGSINGLFRVRSFHQDDAHIFMLPGQIQSEILGVLDLVKQTYELFGLTYEMELSTRPEKSIGTDEDWELATEGLRAALDASGRTYRVNEGDGAFYGPKIDFHITDAIGRSWQCGTIQLDMALPERFDMEYIDSDGELKRPIMIHRAIFGSIERFYGILIEHFAGKFPLWLSPRQVRILPVAEPHRAYAEQIYAKMKAKGLRVEVDGSNESLGKRIRASQLDQVNYMLTVGDKEVENATVSVRLRDNSNAGEISVDAFIEKINEERLKRHLQTSLGN